MLLIQEEINSKKLELYITNFIKDNIYKNKEIECCPNCGGNKYIKYGSYKQIQRYKCKECKKTFSKTTNSLWSYSKKDLGQWIKFVELMMKRKTLRFCAETLNINVATAFYWRHKILYGLKIDSVPKSLNGNVHLNKTILKENFKGNRKIKIKQRRRNIWVVAARGSEDSMLVMPAFNDFWDWKAFDNKIYSKIGADAYIVPYQDRYIKIMARRHNGGLEKEIISEERIKYIIVNLRNWIGKFKGVASKYLEGYLSFFVLFNLDREIDYEDIIWNLGIKKCIYKNKRNKSSRITVLDTL